jgi:hypothetical protein
LLAIFILLYLINNLRFTDRDFWSLSSRAHGHLKKLVPAACFAFVFLPKTYCY